MGLNDTGDSSEGGQMAETAMAGRLRTRDSERSEESLVHFWVIIRTILLTRTS